MSASVFVIRKSEVDERGIVLIEVESLSGTLPRRLRMCYDLREINQARRFAKLVNACGLFVAIEASDLVGQWLRIEHEGAKVRDVLPLTIAATSATLQ